MTKPRKALVEAGAEIKIVSPRSGQIQGMHHADKGDKFDVDIPLDEARPEEFDALMIPGGLMNPDELRATHLDSSDRSEEHTSELQSRFDLVCRLLLEKKKTIHRHTHHTK